MLNFVHLSIFFLLPLVKNEEIIMAHCMCAKARPYVIFYILVIQVFAIQGVFVQGFGFSVYTMSIMIYIIIIHVHVCR